MRRSRVSVVLDRLESGVDAVDWARYAYVIALVEDGFDRLSDPHATKSLIPAPRQSPPSARRHEKLDPMSRVSRLAWWRSTDDEPDAAAAIAGEASAAAAEVEKAMDVPLDPTAAAFFDVDNTMMMGASLFHFARGMAARKFFTFKDLSGFAWQQMKFRIGGSESHEEMQEARESALAFVKGKRVDEIVRLGEEIYDDLMAEKIYSGSRALAQTHLDQGQRVWLITATPVELAQLIAKRLGLTGALGTVAESRDGVYTGKLVGEAMHGQAKAAAIKAIAVREGLDLSRCSAYSDSSNDIPMLSLVGHPCAVNPDSQLKLYAKAHNWPIKDFRTGRKAAKVGIPAAAGTGALAGAFVAGMAMRGRRVDK